MKLRSFKEKLPVLGSNILVVHQGCGSIGICQFTLEVRKSVISEMDPGYYTQYYY